MKPPTGVEFPACSADRHRAILTEKALIMQRQYFTLTYQAGCGLIEASATLNIAGTAAVVAVAVPVMALLHY